MTSSDKNKKTAFFLVIIFPFVGLIYTLCHWHERWAKNTFWLACFYMGTVLIYCPEGEILGEGFDSGRIVLDLIRMNRSNITLTQIFGQYQIDEHTMDLYKPLMTYFISRFTDNGRVLLAAFAFVFGFFYSRNIWYILEKLPEKKLGGMFILVALYFLICPITQINGVRMWTALHVYVYGMMPYLLDRDRSKLWWVLLTPLIHFSFLYVAIFAIGWFLLPYRLKTQSSFFLTMAFVFFIVTLFVNTMNLNTVGGMIAEYSPESFENRMDLYLNENYASNISTAKAQRNWYVSAAGNITHWCYNLLLLAVLPCLRRNFKNETKLMHLYVFALLLSGFANIMAFIPSGGRFQVLSQMFKVPIILLVAMGLTSSDKFYRYVNISLVFLLLPFVFKIRELFDFFSITLLLGNFITIFFWENNVPLISLIKQLF